MKEDVITLQKSKIKTVIKSALITFGILALVAGLLNPLTYYFGKEATAACDSVDFLPSEDGNYTANIAYHYFISGNEYSGEASFTTPFDETLSSSVQYVRYIPFFPAFGILLKGPAFPLESIIISSSGFIILMVGIFFPTAKKVSVKESVKEEPSTPIYICPACEREIDKDSIFCNYCGHKLLKRG